MLRLVQAQHPAGAPPASPSLVLCWSRAKPSCSPTQLSSDEELRFLAILTIF